MKPWPAFGAQPRHAEVFVAGSRIRMNVLAMFINAMIPWAFYCCVCALICFWPPERPWIWQKGLLASLWLLFLLAAAQAVRARRQDPNPTWYTYFACALLVALVSGSIWGFRLQGLYMETFDRLRQLKVLGFPGGAMAKAFDPGSKQGASARGAASPAEEDEEGGEEVAARSYTGVHLAPGGRGIDLSTTSSAALEDAGLVLFSRGSELATQLSGHFKTRDALYCVAPLTGPGGIVPLASYNVWAVGKDCCSVGASDYRCGAWGGDVSTIPAVRAVFGKDMDNFRLAAEQAASVHSLRIGVGGPPVFFYQAPDMSLAMSGYSFPQTIVVSDGGVPAITRGGGNINIAAMHQGVQLSWKQGMKMAFGYTESPYSRLHRNCVSEFNHGSGVMLVFFVFAVFMATAAFSFLGRGSLISEEEIAFLRERDCLLKEQAWLHNAPSAAVGGWQPLPAGA